MKYFYDTEFIEDGKTIDLISIGIVAEDGREFYAVSTEFRASKASDWVKQNVLVHLPERYVNLSDPSVSPRLKEESQSWMGRSQIKAKLLAFVGNDKPELWGYYSAYDHVALCQLFGTMMELPRKGWHCPACDVNFGKERQQQTGDTHWSNCRLRDTEESALVWRKAGRCIPATSSNGVTHSAIQNFQNRARVSITHWLMLDGTCRRISSLKVWRGSDESDESQLCRLAQNQLRLVALRKGRRPSPIPWKCKAILGL
jgi:hypothetical protein